MSLNQKFVALATIVGMNLAFSIFMGPMALFSAVASLPMAAVILLR